MNRPDPPALHVRPTAEAAAQAAASEAMGIVRKAVIRCGAASVALAGGTTPTLLYRHLVAAGRDAVPWDRVTFAVGDERLVPVDSPESNVGLATRELLAPLGIPPGQMIAVDTTVDSATAAARYEQALRHRLGAMMPRFDLVLLGIGADGHTASLFPGHPDHPAPLGWITSVLAPAGYTTTERVSFSLGLINSARAVIFLATGESKRDAVRAALHAGARQPSPAAQVRPTGRLMWFVDAAAAP